MPAGTAADCVATFALAAKGILGLTATAASDAVNWRLFMPLRWMLAALVSRGKDGNSYHERLDDLDHIFVDGQHIATPRDVLHQQLAHDLISQSIAQPLDARGTCCFFAVAGITA